MTRIGIHHSYFSGILRGVENSLGRQLSSSFFVGFSFALFYIISRQLQPTARLSWRIAYRIEEVKITQMLTAVNLTSLFLMWLTAKMILILSSDKTDWEEMIQMTAWLDREEITNKIQLASLKAHLLKTPFSKLDALLILLSCNDPFSWHLLVNHFNGPLGRTVWPVVMTHRNNPLWWLISVVHFNDPLGWLDSIIHFDESIWHFFLTTHRWNASKRGIIEGDLLDRIRFQ